ncbi:hypothetical protein ACS0TY_022613 [Phlomoides rotata]
MGQAFRRATGRIANSRVDTTSHIGKSIERTPTRPPPPPPPPPGAVPVDKLPTDHVSEGAPRVNMENILEDRDPKYDDMLSKMVGRIQSKPGGKLEMGEAAVVEKYKRPLPKLRNTTAESSRYEQRHAPPGTLNITQIRQIIQLHQGKSNDHDGPMDASQIAESFKVDVAQVRNILQYVSLPPEDDSKKKDDQE